MTIKYPFTISAVSIFAIFLLAVTSASAYEFPPYEGLSLKIEGNVTESYSNNLTFTSDKENRIEDFITMFTLNLDTKYEGKRWALGFAGRLSRRIKTETTDIQNSSESLTVNFRNDISKYDSFAVSNTYTHTQVPGSFEEEFGRITGRFDSYSNRLNLNYNKSLGKHFAVNTGYTNGKNWSAREGTKNSYRNNLNIKVNYAHSDMTQFSLSYAYADSRFEGGGDITTNSINAGIRQYLTKRLFFDGSAGVVYTPYANNSSFGASLSGEIGKKTKASLSYLKTVGISSDTENIFRNWRITGQLKKQLLEDLSGTLSVFYGEGEYDPWGIRDKLAGASTALNYNFWKNKRGARVKGRLGYSYSELNSNADYRDYDRNTVNTTLALIF